MQYDASHSTLPKTGIASPELLEHPVAIGPRAEIHIGSSIGAFSFVNSDTIIYRNVKVGRFVSFARNCEIGVANHPTSMLSTHSFQYSNWMFPRVESYKFPRKTKFLAHETTTVGHDVWIGAKSIVIAGVTIGHGAIVAANSVVNKDVPPYAIVGGTPARFIRFRFSEDIIERLLKAEWWNRPLEELANLEFSNVEDCLNTLEGLSYMPIEAGLGDIA